MNEIRGTLIKGRGEGRTYVELYRQALDSVLGFSCFSGTLNIKVKKPYTPKKENMIFVRPPERKYFPVWLEPIILFDTDAAFVFPEKTFHGKEILEILSPFDLRKTFRLKDGDEIVCYPRKE